MHHIQPPDRIPSDKVCSARPLAGSSSVASVLEVDLSPLDSFDCLTITSDLSGALRLQSCDFTSNYLSNQQYSITAVTTSTGSVAERYAYTAYGQPTFLDASGTPLTTQISTLNARYLYTGREWDATLGLYHFRARWMSGVAGRFMGRDPIGFKGGDENIYRYAIGNVLIGLDPIGLEQPWHGYPGPRITPPLGAKITWSPSKSIDKCNEWKSFFEDYVNKGPCAKKYNVKLSCTNCFGKRQGDYTEPKQNNASTTCKTKATGNEILVEACGDQTDPDIMFSVLKHEFQYVIDICKTCSECELADKQDWETDKHHCFDRLCMELRIFITLGVCDNSEFDENKRKECLRGYLTENLDIPFHNVICTKDVLDVVMTKCYTEYRIKAPDFPAVPDVFPKNP